MKKDLIIETDIGRDLDDVIALALLLNCEKYNIKAVTISPGDKDQVAVARFILDYFGFNDVPIGVYDLNRNKQSSNKVHYDILNKYKFPLSYEADDTGVNVIKNVVQENTHFFICGPLQNIKSYLKEREEISVAYMQGGFVSYDVYSPKVVLDKFIGRQSIATFNLNGDKEGAELFLEGNVGKRCFIGKNVCHTVCYDSKIHDSFKSSISGVVSNFIHTIMDIYLQNHSEKMLHDPTAALCMINPDIAKWITGKLVKEKGEWRTIPVEFGDSMAVDLNYEMLWNEMRGIK